MRRVLISILVFALLQPALAAPLPQVYAGGADVALKWIKNYRAKPDPLSVPRLIRALSQQGTIKDPESSGVYVGFFAGVLHANPAKAWSLIEKALPLPFEDQWIVIRALAYSGLPDWKSLMQKLVVRLPDRRVMAERYISGDLPPIAQVPLEPHSPGSWEKVSGFFTGGKKQPKRQVTYVSSPELIDALWGIYFATGSEGAIAQIVVLLPWSKDRDNTAKLTIGSMAKFTLASNAARDAALLSLLKRLNEHQSKEVKPVLADVIEAAELVDTARLGKEAFAALDELKRKGPGSTRDLMSWGAVGEAAISLGCLGLAVAGQVEAGIPCVVGGALSTGALRYLGRAVE